MNRRWRIITALLCLDAICTGLALSAYLGDPLNLTRLPVGDGKFSTTAPERGSVYVCAAPRADAPGAFRAGPWIGSDGFFDFTAKAVVDGAVAWPEHRLSLTLSSNAQRLSGNGLPSHTTGVFPIAASDDAYQFDRNPNRIRAWGLEFSLPAAPESAARATCTGLGPVGVMLTGSVIYNALDAGGRDALAHETQDACQGHPDPAGRYHYHSLSTCAGDSTTGPSRLLGYALDGYGIYGPRDENGRELHNADLDECHGRVSEVIWQGKQVAIYHYVATAEYPYTVGCFRGTPVRAR